MTAAREPSAGQALRVELCREADVPLLMQFIGAHWRAGHILSRDETLLRWQFAPALLRGQDALGPTVLLAWCDEAIVGMLGLTGFDFNMAGERLPAVWLSHWFSLPAHRGHNVALRLFWAARQQGFGAIATLGANEVATNVFTRLGFEVLPSLPRWVGVLDARASVELVRAADPATAADAAERLCHEHLVATNAVEERESGFRVVGWSAPSAAAWDLFWTSTLAPRLVGATRDAEYLHWRYVSHPRFEYQVRFAQASADGAVEGMMVCRVETVRGGTARVLRVVEFLASPAAAATLARSVVEVAGEAGVAFADFHCSSEQAAEPLQCLGFRRQTVNGCEPVFPCRLQPLERGFHPMIPLTQLPQRRHENGTLRELAGKGRLYITSSDCDQDRPN